MRRIGETQLFTQCLCVLLKEPIALDAVAEALKAFTIRGQHAAADHWAMGGPAVSLEFRPEVNGAVLVDVVDQAWPDSMGNPNTEPELFAAWTAGNFGPGTYPGSLLRATQQSWAWKEGRDVPLQHRAFLRVRTTYALGAGPDAPVYPEGWDTVAELQFATKVVLALLQLPQALCYFNPNGEVLRDLATLKEQLGTGADQIPVELWINIRLYEMEPAGQLMDTVGNGQLNAIATAGQVDNLRDVEALFPAKRFEYRDVDNFLRDLTQYLYENGDVIQDGHTIKGPGDVEWQATLNDEPVTPPARRTLRVAPAEMADVLSAAK
jgi:hypothetical protein